MPVCHFSYLHPAGRVLFTLGHPVTLVCSQSSANAGLVTAVCLRTRQAASLGGLCVGAFIYLKFPVSGTRIIYDRKFLLDRRNSPMAQTPPCHLPNIPGVTSPGALIEDSRVEVNNLNNLNHHDRKHAVGEGPG